MNQVKEIVPFVALADSLESSNRMFAYYLRKYATDRVYQIYQTAKAQSNPAYQEIYPQLDAMIKKTEELTRHLDGQLYLKSNLMEILNYADRVLIQADDQLRVQRVTSDVQQNFQTAWRLYEMVNYFSKLNEDQDKRRVYAKTKSVEIFKKMESGNQQISSYNPPPIQNMTSTFHPQSQFQNQSPFQQTQSTYNPVGNGQAYGKKKRIDPQKIMAQTTAINQLHNAVSQLEFNRVNYAKESIRKALSMIERYND